MTLLMLLFLGCEAESPSSVQPENTPQKMEESPATSPPKKESMPTKPIPAPQFSHTISTIPDDIRQKMKGVTWREGCPLSLDELSLVQVSYINPDNKHSEGKLIVASKEAENIAAIFKELYKARYPIVSMKLMHNFKGSDDASMKANNTSAFNCRNIKNTNRYSQHSYGEAIDVNPLWNPWVKGNVVDPPEGAAFLDRTMDHPGFIRDGDIVVTTFAKYGWKWGGHWTTRKDYQHFSTSGK